MENSDEEYFYRPFPKRGMGNQRTPSTIPHQNAMSDVHKQTMVAIRGKMFNTMGISAAERANRCAEVRLENTKKHIDFMQHRDLVKLNKERFEMLDKLEKFKKNMASIKSVRTDRQDWPLVKPEGLRSQGQNCLPLPSPSPQLYVHQTLTKDANRCYNKLTPLTRPEWSDRRLIRPVLPQDINSSITQGHGIQLNGKAVHPQSMNKTYSRSAVTLAAPSPSKVDRLILDPVLDVLALKKRRAPYTG